MTRDEITAMQPGRELDALVLEVVFGFPQKKLFPPEYWEEGDEPFAHYNFIPSGKPKRTHMIDARSVPDFSFSIAAAWQIIDKLRPEYDVMLNVMEPSRGLSVCIESNNHGPQFRINVKNSPEAICKAALLTLLNLR